ncbi:MAG: extracellular solute-binding protein [Parcubacteria group bacterium]|nr:extracellular solute-binding protein [Parcubacteria group bacterium]
MKNKKYVFLIFSLITILIFGGLGCKESTKTTTDSDGNVIDGSNGTTSASGKIEIEWWRLWDSQDVFKAQIKAYEEAYPNIKINYRKLTYEEYEDEIVSALASGKGPDIWSIHNTWLARHIDKLAPIPSEIMTPDIFGEIFVDTALYDLQDSEGNIYGIPFSVDTLAMYYNKDFFNTEGLTAPPETWTEFKDYVKELTQVDSFGNVKLAGGALGTSQNVTRAVDILYLLMLQNGTQMTDEDGEKATFDAKAKTSGGEVYTPGLDALIFYTDFADPKKSVYSWNPAMHNSIDSFIQEEAAMAFGYSYHDAIIKSKAPNLNYDIAEVPQIQGSSKEVNYANYWAEVVSTTSAKQKEAWNFLNYLAKQENVQNYSEVTKRPAARKDVIENQLNDPLLKVFSKQALTAESWYQVDADAIEGVFSNLIESVALDEKEAEEGLDEAIDQVTNLMKVK